MTRKAILLALAALLIGLGLFQPVQHAQAGCPEVTLTITNLTVTTSQATVTYNVVGSSTYTIDFTATDQSSGYTSTVGSGSETGVTATTGRVFSFALNPAQVAVGEGVEVTVEETFGCDSTSATANATGPTTTSTPLTTPAACDDGRINYNHCDKIAMYAMSDEGGFGLDVLIVDHLIVPRGAIFVSAAELDALPDNPARNILIATSPDGLVRFYKLAGGEYQVNYGPDEDNKVFVFRWTGLPPAAYPNVTTYIKAS